MNHNSTCDQDNASQAELERLKAPQNNAMNETKEEEIENLHTVNEKKQYLLMQTCASLQELLKAKEGAHFTLSQESDILLELEEVLSETFGIKVRRGIGEIEEEMRKLVEKTVAGTNRMKEIEGEMKLQASEIDELKERMKELKRELEDCKG